MISQRDIPLDPDFNLSKYLKTNVRPDAWGGVGLFALLPIQRDEWIADLSNCVRVPKHRLGNLHHKQHDIAFKFAIMGPDETLIFPGENLNSYWFINHSVTPNVYFDGMTFKALRDIEEDEELTMDYASIDHRLDEMYQFKPCN